MFKRTRVCTAVLAAVGSGLLSGHVLAQQAAGERVEITGSRIKSLNVDTASPITVIDAKEIKQDGVRNVENFLNNLPQVFAAQAGTVVNGSTGTASVNLRGLGAGRTLVLMNGRRLPMGSANTTAADLNQIPAALVRRVELLTGGASAVYGSDAVAGVVNFIMNDRFEGVQVELSHSFFNHGQQNPGANGGTLGVQDVLRTRALSNPREFKIPGDKSADGKSTNFSLLLGGNFDGGKGNATVFINYKKDDALLQSERDFSSCSFGTGAVNFACGGSGTNATGRITNLANGSAFTVGSDGNARPFANATDQYNFGPLNYFQRPSERYGFNAFANYQVHPNARVYSEFSFHDDQTIAQIAPGGIFGNIVTVRGDNPLLNASWRTALGLTAGSATSTADVVVQRRNVEGGGRQSEFRNTSFRTLFGVKGDVGAFSYDAYAIESKVVYAQSEANYFLDSRIEQALTVVPDGSGGVQCADAGARAAGCVPYNVWQPGGVSAAQLTYLQTPGFRKGGTTLKVAGLSVSADLAEFGIKSPMAKNGIGVSVGLERRAESLTLQTDQNTTEGALSGSGGPTQPLSGEQSVVETFAEVRLPLIEGKPFADLLEATLSARTSSYKSGFDADTYGVGFQYAPIRQVRVRGGFQRAVRAPNLIELYTASGNALFDLTDPGDPCEGPTPTRTLAECARTGVTPAQYGSIPDNPTSQFQFLQGGNVNLKPETADSVTIGLVLQPMRDLTVSIDYFDIKVDQTIDSVDPGTTLNKCLSTGNSTFCNLITRDRAGTLWLLPEGRIEGRNSNLGTLRTSGLDLALSYNQRIGALGSVGVTATATFLDKYEVEEIKGDGTYDCVGYYGPNLCEAPNPKRRHKMRLSWATPWDVELAATWRYFSAVSHQALSGQPALNGTKDGGARINVNAPDRVLNARNYFDLAVSWNILKGWNLTAGVNNVLDKDPPLTSQLPTGQGNGNTFPTVYDALGRKVFLTTTYKF